MEIRIEASLMRFSFLDNQLADDCLYRSVCLISSSTTASVLSDYELDNLRGISIQL